MAPRGRDFFVQDPGGTLGQQYNMNDTRHQSLFFVSLPELQKLCATTVTLNSWIPEAETRSTQIKICRQLLFLYQDILSAPVIGTLNQISVVMTIPFYKSGICQAYIERQGATLKAPQSVSPAILQTCLSYTLTARLAPRWNKAGHLLVQGKEFLSHSGRQNAVVVDLNVSERQLCISVEPCSIRLPPAELEDFDISANTLKLFDSNENTVIHQHSILSNWCYVLPSMKMGQIISISHIIPPESPFRSYTEFQMHWKNLYGYILPEDFGEKKIYFSVYFKPIGERFFTYPLSCIRSQPVQYLPRTDSESVLNSFLSDMKQNLSHLCGFPVKMTSKALYATQELSRALEIKSKHMKLASEMVCVVSLTEAPPRKQTLPNSSSCSMESSHWMEHLIKEPETHAFLSSRKGTEEMITGNDVKCETLTSKPASSIKESNLEISVKKGGARKRQKEENSGLKNVVWLPDLGWLRACEQISAIEVPPAPQLIIF
ncbi:hypothetical protein AV530_006116 [Patagioenas fasciata monilis]|uniref:DUF4708 domain-containing protein n=1 Tax=Patagioenas fasciata monilis TaxID=372326 RepID=A0A1V4J918_PATFA|nr:hypothetical protein AV530_006116 [Patagioenas fasciata monilis]